MDFSVCLETIQSFSEDPISFSNHILEDSTKKSPFLSPLFQIIHTFEFGHKSIFGFLFRKSSWAMFSSKFLQRFLFLFEFRSICFDWGISLKIFKSKDSIQFRSITTNQEQFQKVNQSLINNLWLLFITLNHIYIHWNEVCLVHYQCKS